MLKLNLGCGPQVVDGWVNVDYALGARLAAIPVLSTALRRLKVFRLEWDPSIRIHDLTKPLPWQDGTVDVCYTSHTVEHMSRAQGAALVREAFRVLRPGGVLRVIVPDLRPILDRYRDGRVSADQVVEQLGLAVDRAMGEGSLYDKELVEFPHKCMYDPPTMIRLLQSAGFDAQARAPFESEIDDIRAIEVEDRTVEAVIVEGRKPGVLPASAQRAH